MHDITTQVTLGVFLSTGLYCLLCLRSVEGHDAATVPHLSILAAVVLAVLSMAMLIVFIHHVAMLIQAPLVVAAVATDLDDAIQRLFPDKIGEVAKVDGPPGKADAESQVERNSVAVRSTSEGYIQAIDGDGLMNLAVERDLIINLRAHPGGFISTGTRIADVSPAGRRTQHELDGDELRTVFNGMIIVGVRRTPRQDVECAIYELVEVAVRSLSPGINDPFTAMNCIDRLGAALGRLAERQLPSVYRYDDDKQLRVIARPVTFADTLDAAFNQIRQYSRDSVAVTIRLLETLASIAEHLRRADDREAVRLHAQMTARLSKSFAEETDRAVVRDRLTLVEAALASAEA